MDCNDVLTSSQRYGDRREVCPERVNVPATGHVRGMGGGSARGIVGASTVRGVYIKHATSPGHRNRHRANETEG